MHLEAYLAETRQLAERQCAVLDQAAKRLNEGDTLSDLEENGLLHALQVLTENAIGKAKHILKLQGHTVPISAYDTFHQLIALGHLPKMDQPNWNAIIGLRNRIVHDYLNLDMSLVLEVVQTRRYYFIRDFLMADIAPS
nr:DUF86 domain-containing protein [uncultured Halomonas sp.]